MGRPTPTGGPRTSPCRGTGTASAGCRGTSGRVGRTPSTPTTSASSGGSVTTSTSATGARSGASSTASGGGRPCTGGTTGGPTGARSGECRHGPGPDLSRTGPCRGCERSATSRCRAPPCDLHLHPRPPTLESPLPACRPCRRDDPSRGGGGEIRGAEAGRSWLAAVGAPRGRLAPRPGPPFALPLVSLGSPR